MKQGGERERVESGGGIQLVIVIIYEYVQHGVMHDMTTGFNVI